MAVPCALIASCTSFQPAELVKEILGGELPSSQHVLEEIHSFPWHIDTKYYTADVLLCTSATRTIGNQEFAASVHAFILHFDSNEESSFLQVHSWLPYLKEMEPQVQILLCHSCTPNHVVPRQRVLTWCLENGFELVELETEVDSDEDVDDDFQETTGVKRVIQALHANPWPNLIMKERPSFRSPLMERMMAEEAEQRSITTESSTTPAPIQPSDENVETLDLARLAISETISDKTRKDLQNLEQKQSDLISEVEGACGGSRQTTGDQSSISDSQAPIPSARPEDPSKSKEDKKRQNEEKKQNSLAVGLGLEHDDDLALLNALGSEDDEGEDFEQLFTRMRQMKEKAETMPADQRKAYAEQVAVAFWRAIGGDTDEIEGLSDGELE